MPTGLSIAGSDPSGGAGLQADLKVFEQHGIWGMAVPTALTVQGPEGVKAVHPIDADVVRAQLREVLPLADVVKVGMCGTGAVVRMLAQELRAQTLVL